jgi:hypothetical protein
MLLNRQCSLEAGCLSFLGILAFGLVSLAQEPVPDSPYAEPTDRGLLLPTPIQAPESDQSAMLRRIHALEEKTAKQDQAHKEQSEELAALKEAHEAHVLGMDQDGLEAADETFKPFLNIYGFFQTNFVKFWYEKDSMLGGYVLEDSSFNSNFNLFISSKMTETLSFLGELAFFFSPHGEVKSFEVSGLPDTAFERVDTRVADPINPTSTGIGFHYGSISIERIHLTYSPRDWLNILVGRFLTPYGIWNIDHCAPVVLTAHLPYLQLNRLVPLSQTGIQVHGRFFPWERVYFDYAVTLSNGQGPTESVFDLNENKGLGVRLHLKLDFDKLTVSGGTYAYHDKVTTDKKMIGFKGVSPGSEQKDKDFWLEREAVEVYKNYILASDLKIEFWGILLQAEYVFRYTQYEIPSLLGAERLAMKGQNPLDVLYSPDFISRGAYILAAYRLPLARLLGPVQVTPYFMFDPSYVNDTTPMGDSLCFVGGLNVRPSPYVVLKAEYTYVMLKDFVSDSGVHVMYLQTAISF